ncbi:MAG: hypothetical protein WCG10_07910 [Chlamydiota bacterium]
MSAIKHGPKIIHKKWRYLPSALNGLHNCENPCVILFYSPINNSNKLPIVIKPYLSRSNPKCSLGAWI